MTEERLTLLAKSPKTFFTTYEEHADRIQQCQEEIARYRELLTSTTSRPKEVVSFGSGPSNKLESLGLEIVTLEDEIALETDRMIADWNSMLEAIAYLADGDQRRVLEARYLQGKTWDEIAAILGCSYRWSLKLHGLALKTLSGIAGSVHTPQAL